MEVEGTGLRATFCEDNPSATAGLARGGDFFRDLGESSFQLGTSANRSTMRAAIEPELSEPRRRCARNRLRGSEDSRTHVSPPEYSTLLAA